MVFKGTLIRKENVAEYRAMGRSPEHLHSVGDTFAAQKAHQTSKGFLCNVWKDS